MSGQAPAFEPLNDLERLLVRAATEEDQRPAFARAVLDAQLFAVTPDSGRQGERIAEAGETLSLVTVSLQDGGIATAVFTAPERVAQVYGPDTHVIGMQGRDLIGMIAANPMLLNPCLSYGVLWSPQDLAQLLGRPVERTVETDTQVMLGTPTQRPDDLIFRLAQHFHPVEGIRAVWLALAQWPASGEMAWYLDVRSSLPREQLRELLGRAIEGADLGGLMLDMTVGEPGAPDGTGIVVVEPR